MELNVKEMINLRFRSESVNLLVSNLTHVDFLNDVYWIQFFSIEMS